MMDAPPRECPSCRFIRTPLVKLVKQKGKSYKIFTCTMCHMKDIEPHTPRKLWDGKHFVDEEIREDGPGESFFNPYI